MGAIGVGLHVLTLGTVNANVVVVPDFDLSFGASILDSATNTLDKVAGTGQGTVAVPEQGVDITSGHAQATGIAAGAPEISVSASGTNTVTAGAQGDLIYYLFVSGPAGPLASVPVLIDVVLDTNIQGDSATASAHFNLTAFGLVNDSTSFFLSVGCFTNPPFANICNPNGSGFNGQLVFGLTPGDMYQIDLGASAGAGGSLVEDAATAFADPHIFIDPNFDNSLGYELFFSAGVGNDLPNRGSTGVSEPSSLLLVISALLGLSGIGIQNRRAKIA
jgi:hypothetical protein